MSRCHVCKGEVRPVSDSPHSGTSILHTYNFEHRGERIDFCSQACMKSWGDGVLARESARKAQAN